MNGRIAKLTLAIMGCVKKHEENEMKNNKSISLPLPALALLTEFRHVYGTRK